MTTVSGAYSLEALLGSLALTATIVGITIVIVLIALALFFDKRTSKFRAPIFTAIVVATLATSTIICCCSAYLASASATGGMVSWSAEYQIWACGNQLDLRDPPKFLTNKIGSASLHEHNDQTIHLEGTPTSLPHDFSLGKFFEVTGGKITNNSLEVPLNDSGFFIADSAPAPELISGFIANTASGKAAQFNTGLFCGDQAAAVQAFAYRYDPSSSKYQLTKVQDIANYEPSHADVSGKPDCIIIEFDQPKSSTKHICKGISS